MPITRLGGMRVDIQRGVNKMQGPPEYKVYRSRKKPLSRLVGGSDLDALKRRLTRSRNGGRGSGYREA